MSSTQALSQEQFLLVAANLIHRFLLAPTRAEAKQRFRGLQDGRVMALQPVEMEDKSRAQFGLALDSTEFRGRLNYGAFRTSLEALVGNLAESLKAEKQLTTFSAEADDQAKIFGVTGVTIEGGQANVMVLGTEPDTAGKATILKLMYVNPDQFAPSGDTQTA